MLEEPEMGWTTTVLPLLEEPPTNRMYFEMKRGDRSLTVVNWDGGKVKLKKFVLVYHSMFSVSRESYHA